MAVNWAVTTLGYYGLGLSSTNLFSDPFLSFVMSAAMEIPGIIFQFHLIFSEPWRPFVFTIDYQINKKRIKLIQLKYFVRISVMYFLAAMVWKKENSGSQSGIKTQERG